MSNNQFDDKTTESNTTYFGFKKIPFTHKANLVADVFHSVANRYDVMNDVMSLGIHRIWKNLTIELSEIQPNHKVLDVAAGTGDISAKIAKRLDENGRIVMTDINASMLNIGRDKLINQGIINNIDYVITDAEQLPFEKNTFDCVTIAFGLRNVTDKMKALKSMLQALKPGGRIIILEFSRIKNPLLGHLYDAYSFKLLPLMGKWIANDENSYRYLAESIKNHPDQETLKKMMSRAGFQNIYYQNMSNGIVALHKGTKPYE